MSPRRSDGVRNREALLSAAIRLFTEHGPNIALDLIAADAGVSIATLYRNFDGRQALLTAAFQREIDELGDVEPLLRDTKAVVAFAGWISRFVEYTRTKAALADVLRAMPEGERPTARASVTTALGRILEAGARDGTLRTDLDAADVLATLTGLWTLPDTPDRMDRAQRLADFVVRGVSAIGPTDETGPARPN